ncbi:hypothetical protein IEO21_09830 [Rhodonia placenta]|uniref:Uncharacterized protein n=1 Tax=Rhodonia placenta TaxID=104341 RepID=A0A8H7TY38_9APHY|nr:hypothetical protein IEO21_09830 [Postia placenta]
MADKFFDCSRLEHAFDTQEQIDVSSVIDNRALIALHDPSLLKKGATCRSDESSIPAAPHSGTPAHRDLSPTTSLPSCPASPGTCIPQPVVSTGQTRVTPQAIPQPSLGPRLERNPKPEPSDSPAVTWASSSSAILSLTPIPVIHHPASGLPLSSPPPSPLRGHSSTRSSRSSPGRQSQQPSSPVGSPLSPSSPVMLSPVSPPNKETLRLLLPLRYDGKTVIECDRFLSQLRIYWLVNTSLTTIELKVQLVLVQLGTQGVTTPFANEAAFAITLKARFGNLDNEAAAQVELAKLCVDKSVRKKRTATEFSALFKGLADCSGYGDLELHDKFLSGIPSRVYCKIELETFTTWEDTDKRTTEVEQILDLEEEDEVEHAVVHPDRTELWPASMRPLEKETSLAVALATGSKGTVASSAPIATKSTPITTSPSASTSAASASPEKSEMLAALMAQVKSMHEELEHYQAMKEEGF